MKVVSRYQIPNVSGEITRVEFGTRIVEFWGGGEDSDKLLIAHDGQCVFDVKTAKRNTTWQLAENAQFISNQFKSAPPLIVAIWHQGEVGDSVSRGLDLSPEDYFKSGMQLFPKNGPFDVSKVEGNKYLQEIFEIYVPSILDATKTRTTPAKTAMIGASRGALSTLYALSRFPNHFSTALAHSTHWPIGRDPLVKMTIENLPPPGEHRIWMSHGSEGFDAEYEPFQNYAHELLIQKGYSQERDFFFSFYPGAAHDEASWAIQSIDSLRNWFEKIA